jgi:ATP-dependent helicase HrpB
MNALHQHPGDLLVFLPGSGEIRRTEALLRAQLEGKPITLHPLYGDLPMEAQQLAIAPGAAGQRKVVLATPIAETSLTIEGVTVVIDGGWQKVPRFDPNSGLTRLDTVRVSRASAEQRAGRAGRLGPGVCYRLWSETTQRGLVPFNAPEIAVADLAPLLLELTAWGVSDVNALTWMEPPPAGALSQARTLLAELEALDEAGRITTTGKAMVALPAHPRLAHMMVKARLWKAEALACDIAALLSERDLLRGADSAQACDFAMRIEALIAHRRNGASGARSFGADPHACSMAERAARQWRHLLGHSHAPQNDYDETLVGRLLALAYPDRVAQRRDGEGGRYLLANGRGARLDMRCGLHKSEYLLAADLDGAGDDSRIRLAAPLTVNDLNTALALRIATQEVVRWDERTAAIVAQREQRLGALVLSRTPLASPAKERVVTAVLGAIRSLGLDVLPWSDAARELQARVVSLRQWCPDEGLPDLSNEWLLGHLDAWLAPWLDNITRRDHFARLDMHAILLSQLEWQQQRRLDEGAPTHLVVPSGSHKRLEYTPGQSPVLAVKLQELFGLADTPRVAWGRVPVTLHLLSPAQRPIQVTQDLKGFWERTYSEVKKELKGRYPRHPWPDDPWNAVPTARAKPRGT